MEKVVFLCISMCLETCIINRNVPILKRKIRRGIDLIGLDGDYLVGRVVEIELETQVFTYKFLD